MYIQDLSIVIPAKDEEANIARCIESILVALKDMKRFQIVLVDSCSSDRTVEIAKKYPVKILRLKKHWPKSPSAGRYLGAINSKSKYIFYIDADMAVHKDWIEMGLNTLEKNRNLAGVTGVLYNVYPGKNLNEGKPLNKNIGYVDYLPGAAIYRSDVLYKIKHFNPFVHGCEEKEIGYRISNKGFKQLKLKEPIAYHYVKENDIEETKEKSSYYIGVGQFVRMHFNFINLVVVSKKYPLIFLLYGYLLFFLASVILSIIQKDAIFFTIPSSVGIVLLSVLIIKQRNLKKTSLFILSIFLSAINFIRGLLKKPLSAEEYPTDVEVIQ
jgi:glycosyltransferase involved in cell wall biosynthesis